MNTKTLLVILIGVLVGSLVLGIVVAVNAGHKNKENGHVDRDDGSSSSFNPGIWVAVFMPTWIAIMAAQTPESPVRTVLQYCRTLSREKLQAKLNQYLSHKFKRGSKYELLIGLEPGKVHKATKTPEGDVMKVTAELKDGTVYVFTVVERDKEVDDKGTTKWVIDDFVQIR